MDYLHNVPARFRKPIGWRKDGRPIFLIAGGSGDGDDDGGKDGQTSNTDAGAGQQDNQDGGQGGTGGRDNAGTGTGSRASDDPGDDKTARTVAAIREDFKAERTRRQDAERELAAVKEAQAKLQEALDADKADRAKQMDALAKAMGLKPDDEPPSPEKLAAQLAEAQRQAEQESKRAADAEQRATDLLRQAQVERAVLAAAPGLDANGPALLDSRSFLAKISDLDPAADGFSDTVADTIKAAVEANSAYALTRRQAPPTKSSGGEFNAQPGGDRQWTDDDVAKATPAELAAAIDKGLLRDLGAGTTPKRSRRRGR